MSKKRGKRPDHPRRPTIVRRDVHPVGEAEDQPLMRTIRSALYADGPMQLLDTVSGIVHATEPPPFGKPPATQLGDLIISFEEIDLAETTAVLTLLAAWTTDELLAARIRRVLAGRRQPMPAWLRDLDDVRLLGVEEMRHVQRDGEDYFLEFGFAGGHVVTAMVYVDNNLGGVVKDAFLIDRPYADVRAVTQREADPDTAWTAADPATTRALLEQAIEYGSIMFPPPESDTWPLCRPAVRWLVSLLPPGGVLEEPVEWSQEAADEVIDGFLASPHGAAHDNADHRSLLDDLVWFGMSQGTGDPLRWSPVNVEILLADWFPRKVVAEPELLAELPGLLRSFITYSDGQRGIRADLTAETLAAVNLWEPDYQVLIRSSRPQGAEALARMLLDADGPDGYELVELVGSRALLDTLTDEPLPDEEFQWAGIPDDIGPKIAEMLRLCDENADRFLDVEHRTANRRLLSRVAVADPAFFRGRAAARTSAAAICWMVAQANDSVSSYGELTAQELLEPFGVSSASQRAAQFLRVLGLPERYPGEPLALGSPDLLVGARRAELIAVRDA